MKNIKVILFGALTASLFTACVDDNDFALAPFAQLSYSENFEEAIDGEELNIADWTNVAAAGTRKWKEERFPLTGPESNGYAEFSPFGSNEASNIGWLVSPALQLEGTGKKFSFQAAQHHLTSAANKLEIFVSSNFTGDVAAATWVPLTATVPTQSNDWYEFVNSGAISLSAYSGEVHIAFKVTGNSSTLSAGYQIDNVKLF